MTIVNVKGRDFNPQQYATIANSVQIKDAEYLLSFYPFKGNESVLDIGCGDGQFTAIIAKDYVPSGYVKGLDVSKDMICYATSIHCSSHNKNLTFTEGDVENLHDVKKDSSSTSFNVIFSNHTLHWLYTDTQHAKAVKEMASCLKSKGTLLLCFATSGNFKELFEAGYNIARSVKWAKFYNADDLESRLFPSTACYAEALAMNNLNIEILSVKQNWREFSNKKEFANWIKVSLRSLMSKLSDLSDNEQLSFAHSVVDEYLRITENLTDYPGAASNEAVFLRDVMLFVKAVKN